jgi:hypothetical protein
MKNLFFIFLFYNASSCLSQENKRNLFIFLNEKPKLEVINDSIFFQTFEIDFDIKSNTTDIELKINKTGNLENKICVKASSNKVVILKYLNKKSDNFPSLVSKKEVLNYLNYNDIICCVKFDNFIRILSSFNVYVINSDYNSDEYFIAKKVNFEKYVGL